MRFGNMAYIPERGDIIWLNLALCCPITSNVKGYPFEVLLQGKQFTGAILSDHIKKFDWKVRKAKFIEKAHPPVLSECIEKLSTLIQE
ncbi:MAG: hypothetical protein A2X86_09740 [Bdellovibrionales bacterium GWA2_49_15]|nr:MAG: hypothetical protein A2X86_09740 [Bdellovibrionales bacterium GWA2_49_15]